MDEDRSSLQIVLGQDPGFQPWDEASLRSLLWIQRYFRLEALALGLTPILLVGYGLTVNPDRFAWRIVWLFLVALPMAKARWREAGWLKVSRLAVSCAVLTVLGPGVTVVALTVFAPDLEGTWLPFLPLPLLWLLSLAALGVAFRYLQAARRRLGAAGEAHPPTPSGS